MIIIYDFRYMNMELDLLIITYDFSSVDRKFELVIIVCEVTFCYLL